MSKSTSDLKTLSEKLASICAAYPTVRPQMVADVVRPVVDALGSGLSVHEAEILSQVADLARIIELAKEEIAALKDHSVPGANVSPASDELDAVISHTAEATNAILEACELLDATAISPTGPAAAVVQEATMRIYEACSFQDITGQRITKVVNTLKAVEAKVLAIVETFGLSRWEPVLPSPSSDQIKPDSHLLNGPQMARAAMAQADIDALLADFCPVMSRACRIFTEISRNTPPLSLRCHKRRSTCSRTTWSRKPDLKYYQGLGSLTRLRHNSAILHSRRSPQSCALRRPL